MKLTKGVSFCVYLLLQYVCVTGEWRMFVFVVLDLFFFLLCYVKGSAGTNASDVIYFLCRVGRGSVVVGNVGDNSVSSYRLRASETQQLTDATPRVELLGAAVSQ